MADPNLAPEIRAKMQEIFKPDDRHSWDLLWKENITPWDAGDAQPSLIELIEESGLDFARKGRALVPGCGTGYDAVYLASALGLQTIGMDISESAVEAANRYRDSSGVQGADRAIFQKADFFTYKVPDEERFDLIMDHTFFCAIHPSLRPEWGQRMSELIKPGGYLITICFPMIPKVETGPPYYLRPEHYDEVLKETFEKVYDKVPTKSSENHKDKERMLVWKKK
ncbi:thiol methyltransferase 1 [Coprinopsis cinerea okayama7|uniref:Thiol methyltransferase 1 n=1 Tax=Coprinopsis cinerea (strain Okayama-7 / 130 / ATCC MYA-4618 / FGSC 9003) TaxID=240176 RepID=A8NA76_COPC7|nr:thiol methyltransferase 1 [Coprinopsis cinerea okayama7\|eukprot:XP_001831730.1 thiol methyltransferase 1 [Coprinopsis cinerea okayama7\